MGFRRFSLLLGLRLALILLGILSAVILLEMPGYHAATALVSCVTAGLIVEFITFINKTNREVSRFLDAAKYGDFNQRFEFKNLGTGFKELGNSLTAIMQRIQATRGEQETEILHLRAILEHVPVPLISVHKLGSVTLWNNSARRFFSAFKLIDVNDLQQFGERFSNEVLSLKPGDEYLTSFNVGELPQQIKISASEITMRGEAEKLVSLQNIQSDLDGVQLSAWQDLVRVLTHEIMNSLTPVTSLANTAADLVHHSAKSPKLDADLKESLNDALDAVTTVSRRSDDLLKFVSSYRQLTRLPEPQRKSIPVLDLLNSIKQFLSTSNTETGDVTIDILVTPESLTIYADRNMIEQVLINLVKNSLQATQNLDANITLKGRLAKQGGTAIDVIDNGPGIPSELLDKIFVPFFTTKREGSGVRLALSRQIMIAHSGNILLNQVESGGTQFSLLF